MELAANAQDTRTELHQLIGALKATSNPEEARRLSARISELVDQGVDSGELTLHSGDIERART